jgi:hypothetical protein
VLDQLGRTLDAAQRRAELVRGHGDKAGFELAQLAFFFQGQAHLFVRLAQLLVGGAQLGGALLYAALERGRVLGQFRVQARFLKDRRQLPGQRRQQAQVLTCESVRLRAVHVDDAEDAVAGHQRGGHL